MPAALSKRDAGTDVFMRILGIYKNTYFVEHFRMDASFFSCIAKSYEKESLFVVFRIGRAGGRGGVHQLI